MLYETVSQDKAEEARHCEVAELLFTEEPVHGDSPSPSKQCAVSGPSLQSDSLLVPSWQVSDLSTDRRLVRLVRLELSSGI